MTKLVRVFAIDDHQTTCTDININKTETKQHVSEVYLVFDLDVVKHLRQNRICGQKIGTNGAENLSSNEEKFQFALPLQLSKEEVGVLIESSNLNVEVSHSICVNFKDKSKIDDLCFLKQSFDNYIRSLIDKQNDEFSKTQSERLSMMKNKIIEGKKKKLNEQLGNLESQLGKLTGKDEDALKLIETLTNDRMKILNTLENIEEIFDLEINSKKVQLDSNSNKDQYKHASLINAKVFVDTPEFYRKFFLASVLPNNYIMARTCYESCKYKAYKYLWKEGYYLTCGAKFGGDFLVYEKDPSLVHSKFILVCIESEDKYKSLTLKELITYARIATSVKKTFLLAFYDRNKTNLKKNPPPQSGPSTSTSNNELNFISINWSHLV